MIGRVTKYFEDKRYGFILGENNQMYFIHWSKLYSDDRADNKAMNISVIEATERNEGTNRHGKTNK